MDENVVARFEQEVEAYLSDLEWMAGPDRPDARQTAAWVFAKRVRSLGISSQTVRARLREEGVSLENIVSVMQEFVEDGNQLDHGFIESGISVDKLDNARRFKVVIEVGPYAEVSTLGNVLADIDLLATALVSVEARQQELGTAGSAVTSVRTETGGENQEMVRIESAQYKNPLEVILLIAAGVFGSGGLTGFLVHRSNKRRIAAEVAKIEAEIELTRAQTALTYQQLYDLQRSSEQRTKLFGQTAAYLADGGYDIDQLEALDDQTKDSLVRLVLATTEVEELA